MRYSPNNTIEADCPADSSIFSTNQFESRDEVELLLEEMAAAATDPTDNAWLIARRKRRRKNIRNIGISSIVSALILIACAYATGILLWPGMPIDFGQVASLVDRARVTAISRALDERSQNMGAAEEKLKQDRASLEARWSSLLDRENSLQTQQSAFAQRSQKVDEMQASLVRQQNELAASRMKLDADRLALAKAQSDSAQILPSSDQSSKFAAVPSLSSDLATTVAPASAKFVSMAIDRSANIAVAWDTDQRRANQSALSDCASRFGSGCKIAISGNSCVSIGRGGINKWAVGRGRTPAAAIDNAIRACSKKGVLGCRAAYEETYCP